MDETIAFAPVFTTPVEVVNEFLYSVTFDEVKCAFHNIVMAIAGSRSFAEEQMAGVMESATTVAAEKAPTARLSVKADTVAVIATARVTDLETG